MAHFSNPKKTLEILVIASVTALILNAEGLKNWASTLAVGPQRQVASAFSELLFTASDSVGLTWPRKGMRSAFFGLKKSVHTLPSPHTDVPRPVAQEVETPVSSKSKLEEPELLQVSQNSKISQLPSLDTALILNNNRNNPRWSLLEPTSGSPTREMADESATSESKIKSENGPKSSPASFHFVLFGDSMLKTAIAPVIQAALERNFDEPKIDLYARSATGLARPDVYDWEKTLHESMDNKSQIDTSIVFLGTNDAQNIQEGKEVYEFGSDDWNEIYGHRVLSILKFVCRKSRFVYWVASPPMRSPKFNKKIQALNELVKKTVTHPPLLKGRTGEACVQFVSISDLVSGEKGKYSTYVKKGKDLVKARESDGIHLTLEGAEILSQYLMRVIRAPLEAGK